MSSPAHWTTGPRRAPINRPPRAPPTPPTASHLSTDPSCTLSSTPERPSARDRPELRRVGPPAISRYRPPLPLLPLVSEPPHLTDPFPSLSPSICSRKRPRPPSSDEPPPSHLVAGEPGLPAVPRYHHYNRNTPLSPSLASVDVAVAGIVAGELAAAVTEGLEMTGGPRLSSPHLSPLLCAADPRAPPVRFET